ncbi:MAG: ATP-binding cassette domain-containing protein [Kofleriaceae bacterium]|nr:ATP-binding cassette domain-containing protein [Kofleriaceae bacterium]
MVYEDSVRRTNSTAGVRVDGLGKQFGELWALRDVSFEVPAGTVLGLLGHNGAGKTTALRILTTLARPTEGSAQVAGHDVVGDAASVRKRIGVAGQAATVDGLMTARANLEMVGRLYQLPRTEARRRAGELLEKVGLTDTGTKLVKSFSGGMRRRLDLAAALVASPPVVFLDEPTTGLDPRSRNELWELLRSHVRDGATLVLTTQYLEEADRLADDIVVLDKGRIAAHGTPAQLKQRLGGERIVVTVTEPSMLERARDALSAFVAALPSLDAEARQVTAPMRSDARLVEIVRALDAAGVDVVDVQRREVTLDDVFLTITGSEPTTKAAA